MAMRKQVITLTESAASRVLHLLRQQDKPFLRLGLDKKGCNGLSYNLNYAQEKEEFDEVVKEKGVTVLVGPKALVHVLGMEMDFVEDKLRSEFVFKNPNAKEKCGCGESFKTT